jgi:hypothetical protein
VDKLNRKYTLLVFLFLALPIFTKQYIGDPIECFTPTYFTEPQARYVNSYCWTASTYYLVAADADDDDYDGFTGQVKTHQLSTMPSLQSLSVPYSIITYSPHPFTYNYSQLLFSFIQQQPHYYTIYDIIDMLFGLVRIIANFVLLLYISTAENINNSKSVEIISKP